MKNLAGKVALVSGSGRGIGRAIALKLGSAGARVVVNDLDDAPARETVDALQAEGTDAVTCVGSVTDADFGKRFVQTALNEFGGLDIIVNNAGYTWDTVIQKMTDEQWYAMMDVHLTAPYRILREASGFIREQAKQEAAEGREVFRKVVNVSSVAGLYGNAGQVGYSSAKMGLVGLTRTLSKEWGRYRVNVNAVAFGVIRTRLTQVLDSGEASIDVEGQEIRVGVHSDTMAAWEGAIPLGRAGSPEEAAGAVYLLCTPEANYITGEVLVCGGGLRI